MGIDNYSLDVDYDDLNDMLKMFKFLMENVGQVFNSLI